VKKNCLTLVSHNIVNDNRVLRSSKVCQRFFNNYNFYIQILEKKTIISKEDNNTFIGLHVSTRYSFFTKFLNLIKKNKYKYKKKNNLKFYLNLLIIFLLIYDNFHVERLKDFLFLNLIPFLNLTTILIFSFCILNFTGIIKLIIKILFKNFFYKILKRLIIYIKDFATILKIFYRQIDFSIEIKKYLLRNNILEIDLIHCHDLITFICAARLQKKYKCKVIYDCHEIYHGTPKISIVRRSLCHILNYNIKKKADLIITINDDFKKYYSEIFKQEIKIIYNSPFYINRNQKKLSKDNSPLNKYKNSNNSKILLFQGGFQLHRGLEYILKEAEYLNDDWQIIFMGSGPLKERLINLTKKMNYSDTKKVQFLDSVLPKDLDSYTIGADIGLVIYEPIGLNHEYCTPNKMFEYPRSQLPLICGPTKTLSNFVSMYDFGWSVALKEYELSNLVNSLTDEEIKRKAINADKFINEFDGKKFTPVLEEIYKSYV
jgi:hypothetical protein